jgi:IclR family acetate operon transcriptional repressor
MTKKPGHVPFVQSLDRGLTILQTVARSKQPVTLGTL